MEQIWIKVSKEKWEVKMSWNSAKLSHFKSEKILYENGQKGGIPPHTTIPQKYFLSLTYQYVSFNEKNYKNLLLIPFLIYFWKDFWRAFYLLTITSQRNSCLPEKSLTLINDLYEILALRITKKILLNISIVPITDLKCFQWVEEGLGWWLHNSWRLILLI